MSGPRTVVLAPVGHGKSLVASWVLPLWLIVRDPNIRILIVSRTIALARRILGSIARELVTNERLREDWGKVYGMGNSFQDDSRPWTSTEIYVRRPSRSLRDPTVLAAGVGTTIEGARFDVAILDDPVDESNMTSEADRETVINMARRDVSQKARAERESVGHRDKMASARPLVASHRGRLVGHDVQGNRGRRDRSLA